MKSHLVQKMFMWRHWLENSSSILPSMQGIFFQFSDVAQVMIIHKMI